MAEEEKVTAVAEEATSMADYEKELEASFKKLEEGDMITGTVIAVDEEEITLDLRYYTEGIIKVSDYSREPGFMVKEAVHVGDEVTATVIGRDNRRGCILLSRVEANDVLAWDKLRQLKEDKTVLNVTVKGIVSAGVIAYVEGIRGFIPASKLSLNYVEDLNEYLNKEIQVQVFDVEEEDNRLILSARELLREKAEEERRAKVSNVEVGLVTEGTVESLLDHLPEVVFFCDLHRHGMAVCAGILPDLSRTVQTCIRMAAGRRHYLYHRWHHLRIESADL